MKNLYKIIFAFMAVSFVLSNKALAETNYYLYLPEDNSPIFRPNYEQKFSYNEETKEYEIHIESVLEDQVGFIHNDDWETWGYFDLGYGYYIPIGDKEDLNQDIYFRFPYSMKDITIQIEEKGSNNLSMTVEGTTIPFIFGNWNTETNWKYKDSRDKEKDYNRLFMEEDNNGDWYGKLESDFGNEISKTFKFKYKSDAYGPYSSTNVTLNLDAEESIDLKKESSIIDGFYSYKSSNTVYIKLHFNDDGPATFDFSREPLYPERFVWKDADGNEIKMDEEGKYHHKTTFGRDNNGVTLDNADPNVYTIKYREPNYQQPNEEISLLDLSEENTDSERDKEGYRVATRNEEYLIEEGKINFNVAGNYKIETQQKPTLYVTVAQANVYVQVKEELPESFNPSSNQYTFENAISFTKDQNSNSELITNITTSDFNVSITPQNGKSWVSRNDYAANLTLDEAYEAALIPEIYNQYSKLVSQDNIVYIDGFFSELAAPTVTEVPEGSGLFSLTQIFPCSGVYEVTISPNPQGNFTFDNKTSSMPKIIITPNLYGMFGNTPGFNINGYGFTRDSQTILYPTDEANDKLLKNSVAYKPGTYFDSEFSIAFNGTTYPDDNSQLPINEILAQNTNWINFDFSALALAENSNIEVVATVMKNGAEGEYKFSVSKANIPTAVENIEAGEKGDAVYYNLQGVPVLNPGHGIYIRITNGKAEKIVM